MPNPSPSRPLLTEVIEVEGAAARDDGAPRDRNPYRERSEDAAAWERGWECAASVRPNIPPRS